MLVSEELFLSTKENVCSSVCSLHVCVYRQLAVCLSTSPCSRITQIT